MPSSFAHAIGKSGPQEPKTEKGRRMRQNLLRAARKVFANEGYVNARVTDIAAEGGVSIGNFYRYFADKDDILQELLTDFVDELYQSSRRDGRPQDPYRSLAHATRGLLEVYARNADLFKIMVQVANVSDTYGALWLHLRRPFVARLTRYLERTPEFQRTGLKPSYAASALGSMATHFAYVCLVMGEEGSPGEHMDFEGAVSTLAHLWYRAIYGCDPELHGEAG